MNRGSYGRYRRFGGQLRAHAGGVRTRTTIFLSCFATILTLGFGDFVAQAAEPSGGEVDQTFVVGAGLTGSTSPDPNVQGNGVALKALPDGSALVGGYFTTYRDQRFENIVRVRADGSADPTFQLSYNPTPPEFPAPYTSGNVTVRFGPPSTTLVTAIERVTDTTFLVGGVFRDWSFLKMIDGTGRQVEAFRCQAPRRSQTPWYLRNYCFNGPVNTIESIGNNTFLIGGSFDSFSERPVSKLGRFKVVNNVLTLDETFTAQFPSGNTGTEDPPKKAVAVTTVGVLPNGEYVVGGNFSKYSNRATSGLVHMNSRGELISTFAISKAGKAPAVYDVLVGYPTSTSFVVGGSFDRVEGSEVTSVAFMRPGNQRGTWTVDESLRSAGPPSDRARHFALTSPFQVCDGVSPIITVNSLVKDRDGFIYIGGNFSMVHNSDVSRSRSRIVRLAVDKNVDATWAPGGVIDNQSAGNFVNSCDRNAGYGASVASMALMSNGGLLATGNFQGVINYEADVSSSTIPTVNLVRLTTKSRPGTAGSSATALKAAKPELVGVKALSAKAAFTVSGVIAGNLADGESVTNRRLYIGTAAFENDECRNLAVFDVTERGITPATANGMVTVRAGRYMCAKQDLLTSSGASSSGIAYFRVS